MPHLKIFQFLPKLDCGECGMQSCLTFSRAVAERKKELTACPYVAKVCPGCGHSTGKYFKKCANCGKTVIEARKGKDATTNICPKCGYTMDEPFEECPGCGISILAYVRLARQLGKSTEFVAPEPEGPPPPKPAKPSVSHQCPYCGFITSTTLTECPECGYSGGPGFNG